MKSKAIEALEKMKSHLNEPNLTEIEKKMMRFDWRFIGKAERINDTYFCILFRT